MGHIKRFCIFLCLDYDIKFYIVVWTNNSLSNRFTLKNTYFKMSFIYILLIYTKKEMFATLYYCIYHVSQINSTNDLRLTENVTYHFFPDHKKSRIYLHFIWSKLKKKCKQKVT